MALLGTYSANRVSIVVAGFVVSGYADGTFVEIAEEGEGFATKSGADGEVARSVSTNLMVNITLTLLQSSASNDVLNNLYNADRLSSGSATFPIVIESLSGTTLYMSGQCWVKKRADVGYGKEISERKWALVSVSPNVAGFWSGSN